MLFHSNGWPTEETATFLLRNLRQQHSGEELGGGREGCPGGWAFSCEVPDGVDVQHAERRCSDRYDAFAMACAVDACWLCGNSGRFVFRAGIEARERSLVRVTLSRSNAPDRESTLPLAEVLAPTTLRLLPRCVATLEAAATLALREAGGESSLHPSMARRVTCALSPMDEAAYFRAAVADALRVHLPYLSLGAAQGTLPPFSLVFAPATGWELHAGGLQDGDRTAPEEGPVAATPDATAAQLVLRPLGGEMHLSLLLPERRVDLGVTPLRQGDTTNPSTLSTRILDLLQLPALLSGCFAEEAAGASTVSHALARLRHAIAFCGPDSLTVSVTSDNTHTWHHRRWVGLLRDLLCDNPRFTSSLGEADSDRAGILFLLPDRACFTTDVGCVRVTAGDPGDGWMMPPGKWAFDVRVPQERTHPMTGQAIQRVMDSARAHPSCTTAQEFRKTLCDLLGELLFAAGILSYGPESQPGCIRIRLRSLRVVGASGKEGL